MWRILVLTALVLPGVTGCGLRPRTVAANAAIDRAEILRNQKQYAQAIAMADEAIRIDPENVRARWFRALCWYFLDEYDKTIADLDVGIQLDPTSEGMFDNRAQAYAGKGDHEQAIVDYTEAIRLKPDFAEAYSGRATSWKLKKEFDRAIGDFSEAIRLEPNNDYFWMRRALAWKDAREFTKASEDFEKGVALTPENQFHLNTTAWFLATCPDDKIRNGHKAAELAKRACELTEWHEPMSVATLAAACAENGDFDSAVKYQTQAISLTPKESDLLIANEKLLGLYRENKPYRED